MSRVALLLGGETAPDLLPDRWIISRHTVLYKGEYINYDHAARLDGINVGRNGVWHATGKGLLPETHPDMHFRSQSVEECCRKVDANVPYAPPRWPRLAWFVDPMDTTLLMTYVLVYGLERIEDGKYAIDGVWRTEEPYWGKNERGRDDWLPKFPQWGERQMRVGTLSNIFSDEQAKTQGKGYDNGFACSCPANTLGILFPEGVPE